MERTLNRPVFAVALFLGGLAAASVDPLRAADPAPPADQDDQEPAQKPKAEPPRRFNDDDLQDKYHKKPQPRNAPADAEQGAPAPVPAAGTAPGVPVGAKPPAAPGAKPSAGGVPVKPPSAAASTKPPGPAAPAAAKKVIYSPANPPDPLQGYRAAAAKDEARERELKARRERIAALESRLGYLQAKRNAMLNPGQMAVGNTGPIVRDYDETTGKPVLDPVTGKPSTKPDISPGRATAPVSPMFPPLPPAQTDEDRENDRKMKVKDLLAAVEKEIPVVEEDLARARQDLVDYETRFAIGAVAP